MKFLVDAQLPPKLAKFLIDHEHDAVHVLTLPADVRTPDPDVSAAADEQGRVVVSKDDDFRHSHTTTGTPAKLLMVRTGNISNKDLFQLIESRLADIEAAFATASFVELYRDVFIVHNDD
ncbi:MAG: DUF5615 family PIN-like protein [Nocardioidaceae bacterium]